MTDSENVTLRFFDQVFRSRIAEGDETLNDFERLVLPHLAGSVLEMGCGLGNLAVAAARAGCSVEAFDASEEAISHLQRRARAGNLDVRARVAALAACQVPVLDREWDAIVCIGLLMFLPEAEACAWLDCIRGHVRPGGIAAVNLLVAGTDFMDMFQPGHYCLLPPGELARTFAGWQIVAEQRAARYAAGPRSKVFDTVVARRPG